MLASSLVAAAGRLRRRAGCASGGAPATAAASGRSRRSRSPAAGSRCAVALSPPLDEWSETWLAAHMVQHELLMVVAAPLIAVERAADRAAVGDARRHPPARARRGPPAADHRCSGRRSPRRSSVFLLHALALWVWHLPALYDYALEHEGVHVVQHLCFFGTAALFWWGIAHGRYGRARLRRRGRLRVRDRRPRRRARRAAHVLAARLVRAVPRRTIPPGSRRSKISSSPAC